MKEKPTKAKKKGRTIRAFKRASRFGFSVFRA